MSPYPILHFSGQTVVALHRSPDVQQRLAGRLGALGLSVTMRQDSLGQVDRDSHFLVFDVDHAHDAQFPWAKGQAPMPSIALVGSETPGRLAWALSSEVDAFLPVTALANMYSALVIAHARFQEKVERRRREAELARRSGLRLELVRAIHRLMQDHSLDEAAALKRLRAFAMVERIALEDAAIRYLATQPQLKRKRL